VTQHLRGLCSEWRPIHRLTTSEVAETIFKDQIDILVDLSGLRPGNRLDVFVMKPAPIQITYLGTSLTTGLSAIDYRLTDEYMDPIEATFASPEKLIRLPRCSLTYTPPAKFPDVTAGPVLTNKWITFGSFCSLSKANVHVLYTWAAVLRAVPNSRLVMKAKPFCATTVKNRFYGFFSQNGIDPSRIDLLPHTNSTFDHLAAYELIDIALDTWPSGGLVTTCEALLMGVPVLTIRGATHSQNSTASILRQVNLQGWITSSEEEFVRVATHHSNGLDHLAVSETLFL
jgi:protein O-GlcNAc transferase